MREDRAGAPARGEDLPPAVGVGAFAAPGTGRPPSVDALARSLTDVALPAPLLVDAARRAIAAGDPGSARSLAEATARALLRTVINATGILLHTNLGRAPVGMHRTATASNLELDLASGKRGSRRDHAAALLARLAGAEAALVVNNGAAAVLLAVTALAHGSPVVVSRGELVEIGGGFRIPEVVAASGARLVEVGTTNRTRLADYRLAVESTPGLDGARGACGGPSLIPADQGGAGSGAGSGAVILKVHCSNYRISGFTETVPVAALAMLGAPVIADIGSGLLDADAPWLPGAPPSWLAGEPAARQTLRDGAAVVTFSGDKLLGGPQAGIVAGRADLVEACARHPLARALRPGVLVLDALQETALAYLRRDVVGRVAFWRMACAPLEEVQDRARTIAAQVPRSTVVACSSTAGGGAVPGMEIPSAAVALPGDHAEALRAAEPPVIARVHADCTLCDLRSVAPEQDVVLTAALRDAVSEVRQGSPP